MFLLIWPEHELHKNVRNAFLWRTLEATLHELFLQSQFQGDYKKNNNKRKKSSRTNEQPPLSFSLLSSGLQGCRRFQSSAVNYSTLLLEADSERLYVGARGAVFALSASDVSASSALTVSLFCFARWAPRVPCIFNSARSFICIPRRRNPPSSVGLFVFARSCSIFTQ